MTEPTTIYCPRCHRAVIHYDGKSTGNIDCKCRNCNKLIIYHPKENRIEIKNAPERNTGSGVRFY